MRRIPLILVIWALAASISSVATAKQEAEPKLKPTETWDAVYIAGAKVGFIHTKSDPALNSKKEQAKDPQGRLLYRVEVNTEIHIKRAKDNTVLKIRYGSIETASGEVLRMDSRYLVGGSEMRIRGDVKEGKMDLSFAKGGPQQSQLIDWGTEVRGPYGPEQSMRRTPLKAGEIRDIVVFMPETTEIGKVKLMAKSIEQVNIGGKPRPLLRIDSKVTKLDGTPKEGMDTTYYVDDLGEIFKTVTDALGGMLTYRTTKEGATKKLDAFDGIAGTVAKTNQQIRDAYSTKEATYNVKIRGSEVAKVIAADNRQVLSPGGDPQSATLLVRQIGPQSNVTLGPELPGDEYLKPNPLIDSADPRVISHMRMAVRNEQETWGKVRAIVNWVHTNLRNKNFETTFASASDVARQLSGDCTEHSVLAAAMFRAAGIPSRVAVGLIYVDHLQGFGYHMWNEVYVNRRWVSVDASFRQIEVDAVHIKLSDSSLNGVSPFSQFESVVQAANKITIEPTSVK